MRTIAAIPGAGLLAGAAIGLLAPDFPHLFLIALLIECAGAALFGWLGDRPRVVAGAVAVGFCAGGVVLVQQAWRDAWRPQLRVVFEELARAERAQAAIEHRSIPDDDEAFAVVEGVLRSDAATTASGVSLSIAVDSVRQAGQAGRARGPREDSESAPAARVDEDRRSAGASGGGAPRALENDGQDGQERRDGQDRREGRKTRTPQERRVRAEGGVLATVVGTIAVERADVWRAGRRVRLPIQLHRPSRYLDPGVPDHERALARRGTTLVGTVKSGALVEVVARGSMVAEAAASVRAFARRAIATAVGRWDPRSAAIVAAIVIGDRAGLDDGVQRTLQEAGTYHVIAISGGNIAILAALLLGAFRVAGVLGRAAMWSAIALLTAYAYLVGGGASVDRATLMAVVYFGSRAIDQRSRPLNTLALVAGCLVAADPLAAADPAFVLTCGATLAILTAVAGTGPPHRPSALAALFRASVAAEIVLFPVSAFVFSRVTFAGLALNFAAIPLMGAAQIAGMTVVPLTLVSSTGAAAAGWVAHAGAIGLVHSAALVRFAPFVTYRIAPPHPLAIVVYYGALVAAWELRRRRREQLGSDEPRSARMARRTAAGVAGAMAIWILAAPWTFAAALGDGRLHVTFIDVGQGDAAFVRFPSGASWLVDAGGLSASSGFDMGDRVVAPVLRAAGVRRLDVVALTHGDPDHIGGAAAVLREFRPREVWEGIPVPRFEPLTIIRKEAEDLGARWIRVTTGDRVVVDQVEVTVRHPYLPDWERQKVRNDDSIVLEIRWRDVSILLTGDIGKAVEATLPSAPDPARLRVVKVPHHGSLTSSTVEFVRARAPQIAVVSVGRTNHFGHPASDVLERYRSVGAEIFRTDQDGAVMVDTDGYSADVHTFNGRHIRVSATSAHHDDTKGTKDTKP